MIVKLHRTGHFNPPQTQSDDFILLPITDESDNPIFHAGPYFAPLNRGKSLCVLKTRFGNSGDEVRRGQVVM
jgi:hypothetical protein